MFPETLYNWSSISSGNKDAPLARGCELTSSSISSCVFEGFLRSYILVRYFYLLDTFQFSDKVQPDGTENLTITHLKV